MKISNNAFSRRQFVKTSAAASLAALATPAIHTARAAEGGETIVGSGEHQYRVDHYWAQLPDEFTWQTTHNVAVDSQGLVYVIHEGHLGKKDHPSIFVFDAEGMYVRSFGSQFQGGGHGIETRKEADGEFLYICNYQQQRSIAKLTLEGEQIWRNGAPLESGFYAKGEDQFPRDAKDNPWGRNRFMPTNIAFHPGGDGFYVADGYGTFRIHYYNAAGNWVSTFGSPSNGKKGDSTFNLPHGIWIDDRGDEPTIVVADRANARLQWFNMLGEHLRTQGDFLLPANMDVHGEVLLVPDLVGRVTLLDKNNEVIAHLGEDSERILKDKKDTGGHNIRLDEKKWLDGKFVHPHDACFDADGNIYVAEWVKTGRVTKLTKMS
ncbi:MAG: peptidase [Lacipirellulaceae bacterium]